jgi:hypothetical protein
LWRFASSKKRLLTPDGDRSEAYENELEDFEAQVDLIKQGELDLPARPGLKSSAR